MDEKTVMWKKDRYDHIIENLKPFILSVGYKEEDLYWVPISGLTGENITTQLDPSVCKWYTGPSLI